jgi:hypothetical protein
VTALPTITLLSGGTNQSVNPGTAITQIKYTTANASSVTVSNLPAGISGTWTSNTLTIGGSSTVMGAKIYTVTTANSNGCTNATASGTITVQFFNSSSTWSYGGLTWSDQVNVAACNKTTFTNNLTEPQCRSYTVDGVLIYYYNWPYVNANKSAMCPSPWRVPTRNDFDVLISTTPRYTLIDQWGYGGRANSNSIELTNYGHYMSSTEYDDFNVFTMFYGYYNEGVGYEGKTFGMQVRCVK